MLRSFVAVLLLVLASTPQAQALCPWVEPKTPPLLEVTAGRATLDWKLDRTWFECARKEGGEVTVEYLLGRGSELQSFQTETKRTSTIRSSIWRSNFCKLEQLPDRLQVKVSGTGAFSPVAWTSEVLEGIHCARCDFLNWEASLAIHTKGALTSPGFLTVRGSVGKSFSECARKDSKLAMRIFLGRTFEEAHSRPDPTFVIDGLETLDAFTEPLALSDLCADGPGYVGIELHGDGEFAAVNGNRSVVAVECP